MKDAAELLAAADAVLLDFDGPVTPLMPSPINAQAAAAARAALCRHGITPPSDVAVATDHLAVARWTGVHAPSALADVEAACLSVELDAARTCVPTPGARELLVQLDQVGKPVVIVSNNAADAIGAHLDRHRFSGLVLGVIGRPGGRPDLMKPNTYPVTEALRLLGVGPASAVLIGDSVSDVEVARAVNVRSIGYAKTAQRGDELAAAGADAIAGTIESLVPQR